MLRHTPVVLAVLSVVALAFAVGDTPASVSDVGRYTLTVGTLRVDYPATSVKPADTPAIIRLDTVTGQAWILEATMTQFAAKWAGPDGIGATKVIGWTPIAADHSKEVLSVTGAKPAK